MNIYTHIIRSTVKRFNFIALAFYLLPFLTVSYYKIFHVGNRNFLEMEDVSISWAILIPVFILVLLQSYSTPIIILHESLKESIYKMVPGVRRAKLMFSGSFMLLIMIWSIYILGSNDLVEICAFVMYTLWFISLSTAFLFGFRFMYRSGKYNLLKVLFYFLHSVIIGIYSMLEYQGINSSFPVLILYVLFISTSVYQIINFYKNYSNYKEDYELKFRSGWKKILVNDFFGHLEGSAKKKSLEKLITSFKLNRSIHKRAGLFQFSMFSNTTDRVRILTSGIGWIFYFIILYVVGFKYGSIFIFYMYIYSAFVATTDFRRKDLIPHLYVTSGQKRNDFEFTILLSVAQNFIKSSLLDLVFILTGYFIFANFYNSIDLMNIFIIFGISFLARALIIFTCWKVYLRNKDYDIINKKRMLSI